MFKYYALHRPVDIGTVPKGFINYDSRESIRNTKIKAWGEVYYENRLSQKEIKDFELKEEPTKEERRKALEDIINLDNINEKIRLYNPNLKSTERMLENLSNVIDNQIDSIMTDNLISFSEWQDALIYGIENLDNEEKEDTL